MDEELDDIIEGIISDLASGLIDASDDEINAKLDEYGLSDEDREDILETIKDVRGAEGLADDNPDPLSLENVDAMADAAARDMADEDNVDVQVSIEDADLDGDTDRIDIEKDTNSSESEDKPHDTTLSDARCKRVNKMKSSWGPTNTQKKIAEKKDDENSTNSIARHLANYRY